MNSISNGCGTAIGISQPTTHVHIYHCSFFSIYSNYSGKSPRRTENTVNGGVCYLNVDYADMNGCYFFNCAGSGLGTCVYLYSVLGHLSNFSCFCDINCKIY